MSDCMGCHGPLTGDNALCYSCGKVPGQCTCPPMNALDRHMTIINKRADPNPWNPASPGPPTAPEPRPAANRPGRAAAPPPARPASGIIPGRRPPRTAPPGGGNVRAEWGPVVTQAADFEPESDGDLLDWMTGQVSGMAAYAEALIDTYETGVNAVGIDPKGLQALHDVADAAAHAAETMAGARKTFTDYYELPREFAANGGLMPHDGRWVTGDGDA